MARPKKDGIKATYYIEKTIADKLEDFCVETGIPKSIVVERSIAEYINSKSVNKKSKK